MNDNRRHDEGAAEAGRERSEQSDNEILRVLGRLEGTVTAMQADIAEIKVDAKDTNLASTESRRRIHDKFESLARGVQKTDSTVRVLGALVDKQGKDIEAATEELRALSPKVEATAATVRRWTMRGGAIVAALSILAGGLWYVASANWIALWRFLDQFIPK